MPKVEVHAPRSTLLGQLQRGRGAAWLALSRGPREQAWPLIVECVTNDPRLDSQVEDRADCYATLILATGLELDPIWRYVREFDNDDGGWNTPLAVGTLGKLAQRGHRHATELLVDYVGWGQWWDWILDDLPLQQVPGLAKQTAARIEARFSDDADMEKALAWFDLTEKHWSSIAACSDRVARFASSNERARYPTECEWEPPPGHQSLPLAELLSLADQSNYWKVKHFVRDRVQPGDLALLTESVRLDRPFVASAAFAGLTKLGSASSFPWLVEFIETNTDWPRILWKSLAELAVAIPPYLTLPLAREWFRSLDDRRRSLAEDILADHATREDVPMLRDAILEGLEDDLEHLYRLCDILKALHHCGAVGPIPELDLVFEEFRYSYGRKLCARAMHATNPNEFAKRFAFECLWDCESETRIIGAGSVPLTQNGAKERLHETADAAFEAEDLRLAARNRLSSS